jgi:hypothetical protein
MELELADDWDIIHTDEKDKDHDENNDTRPWIYRAIVLWLYKNTLPGYDSLRQGVGKIPQDWMKGSEDHPLACSFAIYLHQVAFRKHWFGLSDTLTTLLFQWYRK